MTVEAEVANLTTAVDNLTTAVNVSKATLDASVADSESARDQSQAARDTAEDHKLAAEAAATSATNTASALTGFDLDAIAESKAVTAVDVFVYDTSRDSDGGAWRKRTQHTSWYNETLNTATRGARREFPAVAVIVAEATKVTIYDGDDPALPMWMVLAGTNSATILPWAGSGSTFSAVVALNGTLSISSLLSNGLAEVRFLADTGFVRNQYSSGFYRGSIAQRNASLGYNFTNTDLIVRSIANDVAMTVLPDAPIDPATGLPVPTIAVATAGGVSVITDSGAVYDSLSTFPFLSVGFSDEYLFFTAGNDSRGNLNGVYISEITADGWGGSFGYNSTIGYTGAGANGSIPSWSFATNSGQTRNNVGTKNFRAFDGGGSLKQVITDGQNPTKALLNQTTSTYNTGWMNGDIKGAFLSDTDDTDLVGGVNLISNGTFDDTSYWGLDASWTISGGVATVTGNDQLYSPDGVIVSGKFYVVTFDVTTVDTAGNLIVIFGGTIKTVSVSTTGTFVVAAYAAGGGRLRFGSGSGSTFRGSIDNVVLEEADADRSFPAESLIVNGTVTRTPVATGADLVAYSGFSASNYLEQSYNSALDFGTGDFCYMGWAKDQQLYDTFFVRSDGSTASTEFMLQTGANAADLRFYVGGGFINRTGLLPTSGWHHLVVLRESGTIKIYSNGVLVDSFANSASVTQVGATLTIGVGVNSASPVSSDPFTGSLALLRISATAPTAEQIAKIYNDEKFLFQENAQATLYGASDAVTALAHDPVTDLLHVGTSAGRSVFSGLRRVSNTTTAVGTAISASNSLVVEE